MTFQLSLKFLNAIAREQKIYGLLNSFLSTILRHRFLPMIPFNANKILEVLHKPPSILFTNTEVRLKQFNLYKLTK